MSVKVLNPYQRIVPSVNPSVRASTKWLKHFRFHFPHFIFPATLTLNPHPPNTFHCHPLPSRWGCDTATRVCYQRFERKDDVSAQPLLRVSRSTRASRCRHCHCSVVATLAEKLPVSRVWFSCFRHLIPLLLVSCFCLCDEHWGCEGWSLFNSATIFGRALGAIEAAKLVIAPSTEVSGTDNVNCVGSVGNYMFSLSCAVMMDLLFCQFVPEHLELNITPVIIWCCHELVLCFHLFSCDLANAVIKCYCAFLCLGLNGNLHNSNCTILVYKMGLVCSRVVLEANWDLTRDIEPIIYMATFIACEICYWVLGLVFVSFSLLFIQ